MGSTMARTTCDRAPFSGVSSDASTGAVTVPINTRFKADERAYLDEWPMTEAQKAAVLARDLNECIRLGGNIYFLAKIGATDGKSFQQMAGSMTGMSEEGYRRMMMKGGRSVEGNRRLGEDGDAQPQNQPQTDPRQGD